MMRPIPPLMPKGDFRRREESGSSPRQLQTCRDPIQFRTIDQNVVHTKPRSLTSRQLPRVSISASSPRRFQPAAKTRIGTAPASTHDNPKINSVRAHLTDNDPSTTHGSSQRSADRPDPRSKRGSWQIPAFYFNAGKRSKLLDGPLPTTAGDLAEAFIPNPSNPNKKIASKKYFAPRGFGTSYCTRCSRCFLNKELLLQHEKSQIHFDKLNEGEGATEVQQMQATNKVVHLHEFDEEYFELESESESEEESDSYKQERKVIERIRIEKNNFFDYVRDYEARKCSEDILSINNRQVLQQEMWDAQRTGNEVLASKIRKELSELSTSPQDILVSRAPGNFGNVIRIPSPVDEREVFLQKCQELNIAPIPCLVTRRRDHVFDMTHYGAGDKVMQAIASSLKLSKGIQVLSLRDNCIGEQGCVDLMSALRHNKHGEIHTIDLSNNQIGLLGASALHHTMERLTCLDLSGNRLGDSSIQAIMDAIAERSECLRTLILKDNLISSAGAETIALCLKSNKTLTDLNLSWNAIRGKGAGAIGSAMAYNQALVSLNLSWNGFGGSLAFDSWADFFENNTCLTELNLRHNNLDERNAVIITENIRQNETISKLDISENPLGPTGGKLVFKLMDSFGANRSLIMENCNFDAKSRFCTFDPANPQGKYSLDLSSNYDRSVAKALVRIAGITINDQMKFVMHSKKKYDVTQLKGKPQNVPRYGILEFEFYKLVVRATKNNIITARTLHELQAVVSSDRKSEMDRLAQMTTLAEEMALSVEQLGSLLEKLEGNDSSSHLRCSVVVNLFSRLVDRAEFATIEQRLSKEEQATVRRILGELYYFNEENPTAHYRLNLERKYDRSLADKILELNNDERVYRMKHGYSDTSQKGNLMNFRNETLNGLPFTWNGAWTIPRSGILEFDYVSTKRPTPFHRPLELYELGEVLTSLGACATDLEKLDNIRQRSVVLYFTTDQACQILKIFTDLTCKVETAVILHPRITDLENYLKQLMELFRNCGEPKEYEDGEVPSIEDDREILQVLRRIGWLNIWNPLDPDVMYRLDLAREDENLVTQCLVALAVSEPGENWDGETIDGREFELPSTWIKAPPRKGFLEVHYRTDHVSEETVKSKIKRGDNFALRVAWLKKTLIWEEKFKVQDNGFRGNDRASWTTQRSWELTKPIRLKQALEKLMESEDSQAIEDDES